MKTNLKDMSSNFGGCPCGQIAAARKIFNLIQDLTCEGSDEDEDD